MSVKLLIDPVTMRVVYLAHNGVLPERVMLLDAGRQHLFQLSCCEVVEFAGSLPDGINLENSWSYRHSAHGLRLVQEDPVSQLTPVKEERISLEKAA